MKNRFAIADLHLGHSNILNFKNNAGSKLRDFSSVEEMHDHMVDCWNHFVKEGDVVYILGDVAIRPEGLEVLSRLNGSKRLIFGNHDIYGYEKYAKYFKEMGAYRVFVDDFIMSHIPLHPDSITHRFKVNVHGHTHANEIKYTKKDGTIVPDPRYLCVSVEQPWIEYHPMHFDDIRELIKKRFVDYEIES